jgi:hypothetical protein
MKPLVCIKDLIDWVRTLRHENSGSWLFRGHPSKIWKLLPYAFREYNPEDETRLTQEFRARAGLRHAHRPRYHDYADWLALMQHYGLPTRLLDWSHSPLTAAFFATERTMRHHSPEDLTPSDAIVWALSPAALNESQGFGPLVHPLNASALKGLVRRAFLGHWTRHQPRPSEGRSSPDPKPRMVAAAMAIEADIRMQVQRGAFTVHRVRQPLEELAGHEQWLRHAVIAGSAVKSFGEEIQMLGVGLSDLFPDLNNLARDVRSQCKAVPSVS